MRKWRLQLGFAGTYDKWGSSAGEMAMGLAHRAPTSDFLLAIVR